MDLLIRQLNDSCVTGEIVDVVYFGGSQPGARRDLRAISVDAEHVKAHCLSTGDAKLYRLDRMRLATDDDAAPRYVAGQVYTRFATFQEMTSAVRPLLNSAAWQVAETPTDLAVHLLMKNGKPRRRPMVRIGEAGPFYQRPWRVEGQSSQNYATLDRAAEAFLSELGIEPPWPVVQQPERSRAKGGRWRGQSKGTEREDRPFVMTVDVTDAIGDGIDEALGEPRGDRPRQGWFGRLVARLTRR